MFWTQTTSGGDDYEKDERSQSSYSGSSGIFSDDGILEIYWESFGHPNRLRSLGFQLMQKTRHPRIHRNRFHRRTSMRMRRLRRYRPFVLRLPSTRSLIRRVLRSAKPMKKNANSIRHVPMPPDIDLKKTFRKKTGPWHSSSKYKSRRRYRMARMNRCHAWSKRLKRR
jgi:hypothetical protein